MIKIIKNTSKASMAFINLVFLAIIFLLLFTITFTITFNKVRADYATPEPGGAEDPARCEPCGPGDNFHGDNPLCPKI
jgi:hypothetical protein